MFVEDIKSSLDQYLIQMSEISKLHYVTRYWTEITAIWLPIDRKLGSTRKGSPTHRPTMWSSI